jgi:flagellar hook-basal body complex protein FliE
MRTTDPRHFGEAKPPLHADTTDNVPGKFGQMLTSALSTVNSLQNQSTKLGEKMAYDPKSVDAHTVMIAAEKARISLMFTKIIVDKTVRAYRELINMR